MPQNNDRTRATPTKTSATKAPATSPTKAQCSMGGLTTVARHGTIRLSEQMARGRMARYERLADEAYPGLRTRDPREFAKQVLAMQSAHMKLMNLKSREAQRKKKAAQDAMPFACSLCCKERRMAFPSNATERICTRHQRIQMTRKRLQQRLEQRKQALEDYSI